MTRTEPPTDDDVELHWGPGETHRSRHAYPPQSTFARRTFMPRALCGLAWSPLTEPVDDPALPTCRTCARLATRPLPPRNYP